jgi:hypothetical protein
MSSTAKNSTFMRRYATPLVAALLIFTGYWFTVEPAASIAERQVAAARFSFAALPLPEWKGIAYKTVRQVHPSFRAGGGRCAL